MIYAIVVHVLFRGAFHRVVINAPFLAVDLGVDAGESPRASQENQALAAGCATNIRVLLSGASFVRETVDQIANAVEARASS